MNITKRFAGFLVIFLSIGIIRLFLGNWSVQARVLYDIPFQLPAAIGLDYKLKKSNGYFIIPPPIIIQLLVMSIKAPANFHFCQVPRNS
jgi:hypothetical protein